MRCFLDVDGVLCDWTGTVHRRLGIPYDPAVWPYKKGPEGWNWHDEVGWSFDSVSQLCDFSFWEDALWTQDGREILHLVLQRFQVEDITLLTTPMPHVMSASGKIAWINRNLEAFKRHVLICTDKKAVLAGVPDSILIDDGSCNINDWRTAGGTAVLVPRWWNDDWMWVSNAAEIVRQRLEVLCPVS